MTRIFADLQRNDEAIYMNDIIIYAQTKWRHGKLVIKIFSCIKRYKMRINIGKIQFYQKEIDILFHIEWKGNGSRWDKKNYVPNYS